MTDADDVSYMSVNHELDHIRHKETQFDSKMHGLTPIARFEPTMPYQ